MNENTKEIKKLINVLRRISDAEQFAAWSSEREEISKFAVMQYNKVVARLTELEPSIANLFTPLPETASPKTIRFAARELAAYFAEEAEDEPRRARRPFLRHGCCRPRRFVVMHERCC
jgi:hypothetical protein